MSNKRKINPYPFNPGADRDPLGLTLGLESKFTLEKSDLNALFYKQPLQIQRLPAPPLLIVTGSYSLY